MQRRSLTATIVALLCAALITAAAPVWARAQATSVSASFAATQSEVIPINVLVGQSRVINFDQPIGRFSVSNPEVAEAVLVAPDQVLVNGKAFGQVNFIAWAQSSGRFVVFDVFVRANLSLIDSQIRALWPQEDIRLSQANGSVVMSGNVRDPRVAAQAESVIKAAGFNTVNLLASPPSSVAQVQLQVRVAEVSRSRMRELGLAHSYQASPGAGAFVGSGGAPASLSQVAGGVMEGTLSSALNVFLMAGNAASMIRALQTQGALRSLAEPNLIAMDGQQASFLAGGEFPVPVVQGGGSNGSAAVSVEFKAYGVRLNFRPTILDEDHIRLELEPEVSTIDFANGVRFNGFIIPGLRTRRARTGIELRDGQSFALAGLLDNSESRSLSRVPVLGDIPVLGALFRSTSFQRNETELIFIVTAELVRPVNRDDLPQLRGVDGLRDGSPLGVEPQGEGITGASGHATGSVTAPATTAPPPAQPAATQQPAPASATPAPERARPATLPAANNAVTFLHPLMTNAFAAMPRIVEAGGPRLAQTAPAPQE